MQERQSNPTSKQSFVNVVGPCATIFCSSKTGDWRIERPVVDAEKCVRCGICASTCPLNVVVVQKEGTPVEIDMYYCKGCGLCAYECPKQAISMVAEKDEG